MLRGNSSSQRRSRYSQSQLLNFRSWTFFFWLASVVGLYFLHRLSLVHETRGTTDPLLARDLLPEARRSIQSLSSAAGLLRVVRAPSSTLRLHSKKPPITNAPS